MFCIPNDATSPHVDLPASRTLSPFETYIFAQHHKLHFWTGQLRQLLALILNGIPLMFCLPNDTTLASCGLASLENTLAIWDIHFCPKSQIPRLHRINVTTSALNIKCYSAYGMPSQRHHPRLMWTCQLREHSRHLRHVFSPKSQILFLCRIIATISGLNIKWYSAYALPSQRHQPRLMWTCQLREHSRQLRHIFLPKNTNSTFVQDKCDNFCP